MWSRNFATNHCWWFLKHLNILHELYVTPSAFFPTADRADKRNNQHEPPAFRTPACTCHLQSTLYVYLMSLPLNVPGNWTEITSSCCLFNCVVLAWKSCCIQISCSIRLSDVSWFCQYFISIQYTGYCGSLNMLQHQWKSILVRLQTNYFCFSLKVDIYWFWFLAQRLKHIF